MEGIFGISKTLKKRREALAKAGKEADAPYTRYTPAPKAKGLPDIKPATSPATPKPKGTFSEAEESKRKIEELRKKGMIK